MGWTSIYQLFWCSPGVQGFDTLPYGCDLTLYHHSVGAVSGFVSPGRAQDLAPGACCAPPHTALHQWGPGCGGAPFFHPNPLQSWCLNFCRHHIESLGFMMHISMLIILWWKTTVTCNWGDTTLLSSPRSGGLAWGCLKVESQSWCLSKMVAFPWKMSGLWGCV